ncbi:hypothetical protein BOTBODRAFT_147736 [Botryobasidium botryosum FD-172 SS1]|uniref:Uncharacterized protein n=1 Tax=Botryobasidium botryosum (strain FD-172 SS1) TaxID=930990 RepID=A0A067M3N4_BOTB1|nr:hypothetical protein BOTBODRAFT_147736 [Botryobasidium botryosum FD-172 SS1]
MRTSANTNSHAASPSRVSRGILVIHGAATIPLQDTASPGTLPLACSVSSSATELVPTAASVSYAVINPTSAVNAHQPIVMVGYPSSFESVPSQSSHAAATVALLGQPPLLLFSLPRSTYRRGFDALLPSSYGLRDLVRRTDADLRVAGVESLRTRRQMLRIFWGVCNALLQPHPMGYEIPPAPGVSPFVELIEDVHAWLEFKKAKKENLEAMGMQGGAAGRLLNRSHAHPGKRSSPTLLGYTKWDKLGRLGSARESLFYLYLASSKPRPPHPTFLASDGPAEETKRPSTLKVISLTVATTAPRFTRPGWDKDFACGESTTLSRARAHPASSTILDYLNLKANVPRTT